MRIFRRSQVLLLTALGAVGGSAAERVGSDSCRSCHASAWETWKVGAHAQASAALSPAQQRDLRCLHCHAPDLARAEQEAAAFQKTERAPSQREGGVGCESCHGAGRYYSPSYVMKDPELARAVGLVDPGQKSCLVCHTSDSPSLKPFDYTSAVKLIDHWSRGQASTQSPREPQTLREPHPQSADGSSSWLSLSPVLTRRNVSAGRRAEESAAAAEPLVGGKRSAVRNPAGAFCRARSQEKVSVVPTRERVSVLAPLASSGAR